MTPWFGDPWWSYICYDEAGRLAEENRVPFPRGQSCMWCEEPFVPGDSGVQTPCGRVGGWTVEHIHKGMPVADGDRRRRPP